MNNNGHASAQAFLGPPLTSGYRPAYHAGLAARIWHAGQVGLWGLSELELMRDDPRIRFGMAILRGPLATVKWRISADSEVASFIDAQLKRFWRQDLMKAFRAIEYGNAPGENVYRLEKGLVQWDRLDELHVRDVTPYRQNGQLCGAKVKVAGNEEQYLTAPRLFWLANEPEFRSPWGRSRLRHVWPTWKEKTGRNGGVDARRLWYVKNAFRGPRLRHPPGFTEEDDGTLKSNQDYARELVEKSETGYVLALPVAKDPETGEYLWVWEDPAANGDALDVREYIKDLDVEMLEALDIPAEIVRAADTGSGWSGRSVPMVVFLTGEDAVADAIFTTFDRQALRHLVNVNFGPRPYEVELVSLLELTQPQPQPTPAGPGTPPRGEGQPVKLSYDPDQPRDERGRWAEVEGKHDAEREAMESRHEEESSKLGDAHEREDEKVERHREKEDEKASSRYYRATDKLEAWKERAEEKLDAKADPIFERLREPEAEAWEAEDRRLAGERSSLPEAERKQRQRERNIAWIRRESELEEQARANFRGEYDALEAEYKRRSAELDAAHETESEARQAARDREDAERAERQQREQDELDARHDAEREALEDAHETELEELPEDDGEPPVKLSQGEGRWITIGAVEGADGKKHGGSPVFIENGRITKGHPSLTGKKIGALREDEPAPDELRGTKRQQAGQKAARTRKEKRQETEYSRAVWAKQARREGVDPRSLHQLAAEYLAHDLEHSRDRTRALQYAREVSAKYGADLRALHLTSAKGKTDASHVKRLDEVATAVANEFPDQFTGKHRDDPTERLYDLLLEGNPTPMTEEDAYREALERLREERERWRTRDDEPIPFSQFDPAKHPKRKDLGLGGANEGWWAPKVSQDATSWHGAGKPPSGRAEAKREFMTGLEQSRGSHRRSARFLREVFDSASLDNPDKWEFATCALLGLDYEAYKGKEFDGAGSGVFRRGRRVSVLGDAKHVQSDGLALKVKDPSRQFRRWKAEGRGAVPLQVVFYVGGEKGEGRGVYLVPGVPTKKSVSLRDPAEGEWDPASPGRPILVQPLGSMKRLTDPKVFREVQDKLRAAMATIDPNKLNEFTEEQRKTFRKQDFEEAAGDIDDRHLLIDAVLSNEEATAALIAKLKAAGKI